MFSNLLGKYLWAFENIFVLKNAHNTIIHDRIVYKLVHYIPTSNVYTERGFFLVFLSRRVCDIIIIVVRKRGASEDV